MIDILASSWIMLFLVALSGAIGFYVGKHTTSQNSQEYARKVQQLNSHIVKLDRALLSAHKAQRTLGVKSSLLRFNPNKKLWRYSK